MKRWLPWLLVGLAVLLLVAPGLIGRLSEYAIDEALRETPAGGPLRSAAEIRFERGWFTSDGRHEIVLADSQLARLVVLLAPGLEQAPGNLTLLADTRLNHGLLPFPGDVGASIVPALATAVTTLAVQGPDGSELPVPGVLYSRVGLAGSTRLRYLLPAGNVSGDGGTLRWGGADVVLTLTPADGLSELGVVLEDADARGADRYASFRRWALQVQRHPGIAGLDLGEFSLEIDDAALQDPFSNTGVETLRARGNAALDGQHLSTQIDIDATGLQAGSQALSLDVVVRAERLDPARTAALVYGLRAGQDYEHIDVALRDLLGAGARIIVDPSRVQLPTGDLLLALDAGIAASNGPVTWPGVLLRASGEAGLEVDRALVESPSPWQRDLQALVAGGFLRLDGERYRLAATFDQGQANINGAPFPLNLP